MKSKMALTMYSEIMSFLEIHANYYKYCYFSTLLQSVFVIEKIFLSVYLILVQFWQF